VAVRPRQLSITEIQKLIRDPYAIYARHVLRLAPLDPLRPEADPRLRGTVLHKILETYLREGEGGEAALMSIADRVLEAEVAWPLARAIWRARIEKAAPGFLAFSADTGRQAGAGRGTGCGYPARTGLHPDRQARPDRPAGRRAAVDDRLQDRRATDRRNNRSISTSSFSCRRDGRERRRVCGAGPLAEVAKLAYVGLKADFKVEPCRS
jgi:ATP-dependent helicase/nuclease subunit B